MVAAGHLGKRSVRVMKTALMICIVGVRRSVLVVYLISAHPIVKTGSVEMMDVEGFAGVVGIMLCAIWVNVRVRAGLVIVMITGMMVVRSKRTQNISGVRALGGVVMIMVNPSP